MTEATSLIAGSFGRFVSFNNGDTKNAMLENKQCYSCAEVGPLRQRASEVLAIWVLARRQA